MTTVTTKTCGNPKCQALLPVGQRGKYCNEKCAQAFYNARWAQKKKGDPPQLSEPITPQPLPWAAAEVCALVHEALAMPAVRKARAFAVVDAQPGVNRTQAVKLTIRIPVTVDERCNPVPFEIPSDQIFVTAAFDGRVWHLRPGKAAQL